MDFYIKRNLADSGLAQFYIKKNVKGIQIRFKPIDLIYEEKPWLLNAMMTLGHCEELDDDDEASYILLHDVLRLMLRNGNCCGDGDNDWDEEDRE